MRYDTGDIEVAVEPSAKQATSTATPDQSGNVASPTAMAQPGGLSVYGIPTGDAGGALQRVPWLVEWTLHFGQAPPGDYLVLAFDTPQQFEYRNPAAMRAYDNKGNGGSCLARREDASHGEGD